VITARDAMAKPYLGESEMKKLVFVMLMFALNQAWAQKIPNMLCTSQFVVHVNPITFAARRVESSNAHGTDLYRIENQELYISSNERNEYFYNKLTEVEKFRFISGHKTMLFDKDYKTAISTHTYDDEIRVLKLRCVLKAR
jgi:hypothetical protein